MVDAHDERKRRGAWFTPEHLVEHVVEAVIDRDFVRSCGRRPLRIVDPACGDGRFLSAAIAAVRRHGGEAHAVGVDIDRDSVRTAQVTTGAEVIRADALHSAELADRAGSFDVVIGNPPYLSQLAAATTRGGASARGGGPYADVAAEFLALAAELVRADGGRVGFVLPQSILSARDAGDVRRRIDRRATMIWSAWTGERDFDAQVVTCAVAFEFGVRSPDADNGNWAHVVTSRTGVPPVPAALADAAPEAGCLGDRARLNANFRDEYYGMIDAVGDHTTGPPLVTSGLIDPGRCLWGRRSVRFAKQRFAAPRVDLTRLDGRMSRWAADRLVPKVLIANQTPIIEAVCDPAGAWLPGVPVVAAYPQQATGHGAWEIAAVLSAPSVSAWAWHRRGGTGLSSDTIRVGPTMLAELPWPSGSLTAAVEALRDGDVVTSGSLVDEAYGIGRSERAELSAWWLPIHGRIAARAY